MQFFLNIIKTKWLIHWYFSNLHFSLIIVVLQSLFYRERWKFCLCTCAGKASFIQHFVYLTKYSTVVFKTDQCGSLKKKKNRKKWKKSNRLPGQTSKNAKQNYLGLHKNINWNIFINVLIDKAIIECLVKGV